MDIIIQARTTSTRLPQKVIKKLHNNIGLLELEILRLKFCKNIRHIILAITINKTDDVLEELANQLNIKCFRGNENNVLERYYLAAKNFNCVNIIRITGDCPFMDYKLIDKMIDKYYEGEYEYLTNILNVKERTYPRGLDIEIYSFKLLEETYNNVDDDFNKEHVTTYIRDNYKMYKYYNYQNDKDYSEYRVTVDTIEDFNLIYKLYEILDRIDFEMIDYINILNNVNGIYNINKNIIQKYINKY